MNDTPHPPKGKDRRERGKADDSRRRLLTLMGNIPGMAYRCANDRDWTMEFVSEGCRDLTGFTAEELTFGSVTTFNELIHENDRERVWAEVQAALRDARPFEVSYRIRSRDGREKTVWERGCGVRDDAGDLLALEGFIQDVSRQTRVEQELRESEERFRTLFQEAPLSYQSLDESGHFVEVNKAWCDLTGYTADEIVGRPFGDILTPEARRVYGQRFLRLKKEGEAHGAKFDIRRKDGAIVRVSLDGRIGCHPDGTFKQTHCILADVTEQSRAEQALAQSERRYRLLFQRNLAGVYRSTTDGRLLECNEAFARMFGFDSSDEARRQTAEGFYAAPGEREAFLARLHREGSLTNLESKGKRRDGSPMWMLENVSLMKDEHTGEEILEGTLFDITERKLAEEKLKELSLEQQTIFDSIPAMIWYKDRHNRFIRVNRAVADFMGLPPEQIEDHSAEDIFPDFAEKYFRDDLEVIESGRPSLGIIEQARTARGDLRWVRTDKIPYRGPGGDILGVIAFSIDVTEAREAEQERDFLFTAIEQAQEGVVVTSTSGTILYANRAMAELTGYDRSELLGQNPRVLKSGLHDAGFYEDLWKTILAGDVWTNQIVNKRKDGTFYTAHLVISPVRDATGGVTAFVSAQRDVTREVEMEKRLQQARNLETIGRLTTGAAHDVRNPLFAISTIVAALEKKLGPGEDIDEFIVHLKDQSRRLTELMNDLLTLGRPVHPEDFRECLLQNVLQQALELLEDTRPGAAARCDAEPPREDLYVKGAPDKLTQVFVNLLDNAFAFSPPEASVSIRLGRDGDWAALELADRGPGIPEDMLDRLFEPFQSRRKGGTGLGLTIVRQIVTAHGGTVEALNGAPAFGAVFVVRLPLAR